VSTLDSTEAEGVDVNPYRVGLYLALGVLLLFFLAPIETGIVTSFKTPDAVSTTSPLVPSIQGFTLQNYANAVQQLARGMVNSLLYAVPATILSALFGSFAAYGLTLTDWRGQVGVLLLFVAGIFIPYQAVLVPLTQFFSILGLSKLAIWSLLGIDNAYAGIVELIITHTAYGIPICTILFRSYYKGMSEEMLESARLEGATVRRAYRRIVFPLSTPMFAVVLIYQFTQIWNDLLFALVLVQAESSAAAPVTLILAGLGASQSGTIFGLRMAGAFVAALPTLAVYILFGEEFAEGVAT
jgi:glucose/mannose transport system permease protein